MTVNELMNNIEFQSEITFCYYDYESEKRIEITEKQAQNHDVKYIYDEDGKIYIEVRWEEN